MKNCNVKKCKVIEKMKCDFCNGEFPAEELETVKGALHDSGGHDTWLDWLGKEVEK